MLLASQDEVFAHAELGKHALELKGAADAKPIELRRPQSGHGDAHLATGGHKLTQDTGDQDTVEAFTGVVNDQELVET